MEKCSLTDVQFLTETCQVDLNKATYSGCTPLHTASGRGNIAMVAYLLSMGADPELETDEGDSPLDLAGSEQVRLREKEREGGREERERERKRGRQREREKGRY